MPMPSLSIFHPKIRSILVIAVCFFIFLTGALMLFLGRGENWWMFVFFSFLIAFAFFFLTQSILRIASKDYHILLEKLANNENLASELDNSLWRSESGIIGKLEIDNRRLRSYALECTQVFEKKSEFLEKMNLSPIHVDVDYGGIFRSLVGIVGEMQNDLGRVVTMHNSLIQSISGLKKASDKLSDVSNRIIELASDGIRSVGKEIYAISDIRATVGSSAKIIDELHAMARHVGEFVSTINSISKKTHLLALNAGIEAARAGEAGRGFSVVAAEIRGLSDSSKNTTEKIEELIQEINGRTSSVVKIMQNTSKFEDNIKVVYNAGDTFMNIIQHLKNLDKTVSQVVGESGSMQQQTADLHGIMDKLTRLIEQGQTMLDNCQTELVKHEALKKQMLDFYNDLVAKLKMEKAPAQEKKTVFTNEVREEGKHG
jgi:hypothetical protein